MDFYRILFLFCCFYLLGACHPYSTPLDTLVVALDSEPQTLDPRKAVDANGMRLVGLLFNGLVKIGPQLKIIPDGAKSWRQNGLIYEFALKKLQFSNGRFVSKEDIEFSFKEFMKKGSFFYSAFKNISSIKVFNKADNLFVEIHLKTPSATFLSSDLPVIKILPKKESFQKGFHKNPIGTGGFKVVQKHSHEILMERIIPKPSYPAYLSFVIVRDSFTRAQKTLAGQVDIAPSVIPLEKISHFKKEGFKVKTKTGLSTTYLLLNLKNKYLKKKRIRRALSYLINRKEIIRFQLQDYGLKAISLLHPGNYFFNKRLTAPVFDIQKSFQTTRNMSGEPVKLKLSCSNNKATVDKAKNLISQINKGNFIIRLNSYEWGAFYKDLQKGYFDMALMKWVGIIDPDIYRIAFHSENQAPKGRNRSFYANSDLDRMLERGLSIMNKKERKALYDKAQKIISEDRVILPLWHDKEVSIIKANIKGYALPDNGDFSTLPDVRK